MMPLVLNKHASTTQKTAKRKFLARFLRVYTLPNVLRFGIIDNLPLN